MTDPTADPAAVNRATWAGAAAISDLLVEGYSDPGERLALLAFADRVRGRAVLDIGVGPGRTTSLLRLATTDYHAVDFVPEMVDLARRRFPGVDIDVDDARTLSSVADASYDGAMFSFNGIDAVDHDGRAQVLASVHRVLRPGGHLLYSVLHKDGPAYRARPWRRPPLPWVVGSLTPSRGPGPLRLAVTIVRAIRSPGRWPRSVGNYRRMRRSSVDHGDWALAPNEAHDFGLLTHFTTVAGELLRLQAAGFELVTTFAAEDGRPVHDGEPPGDVRWFHLLARATTAADGR
jgi:SAM-dependent methyltransferase